MVMNLKTRFLSPSAAKGSYDLPHDENESQSDGYSPLLIQNIEINAGSCLSSGSSLEIAKEDPLAERIAKLSHDDQLQLISQWLTNHASEVYGLSIPSDFIVLTLAAMKHLQDAGRLNVIYDLVKGFGTKCPDGSDSYFPTKRMPMGLLQYMAQFFVAKPGQNVSMLLYTTYHIAGNFRGRKPSQISRFYSYVRKFYP